MASKSKKRSKRRFTISSSRDAQRLLERGDYRQALKEARGAFRQQPTSEHRCLLEHAYMGRIQQLVQFKQYDDARRIAEQLRQLGITELSVKAALPDLLLALGLLDQLIEEGVLGADLEQLRIKAADQAVVRPATAPRAMPDICAGAARVRLALQGIENNDEGALAHLSELPRQSPFADWKYFARGLAAYYRQDRSGMLANWDRLETDRAAAKIAAPLRVMAGDLTMLQDFDLRPKVSHLEKQVTNHVLLDQLVRIGKHVAEDDWRSAFKTLNLLQGELRKFDAAVSHRVGAWISGVLTYHSMVDELGRLARIVDPLPFDPNLNRARAVACRSSEYDEEEDANVYWRKYLNDLREINVLPPDEQMLARAIVWLQIAKNSADEAEGLRSFRCGADLALGVEDAEAKTLKALNNCFSLAPRYVAAYEAAARFHGRAGRHAEAARIYQRLLEHVPDNLDALLHLARNFMTDQPSKASAYAAQARRLKPLDKTVLQLQRATHLAAVRCFAREGKIPQAREAMAAADRLQPECEEDLDILARKAVLELKADDSDAAERIIERATEKFAELAAFWLAMTIQAIRYGLPNSEAWGYEQRWRTALGGRCHGETAGTMSSMLTAKLKAAVDYTHRDEHIDEAIKYIRRCSRIKWKRDDLLHVCLFLTEVDELKLLAKYVRQGTRKYPDEPYFHAAMGILEMAKGPRKFDRKLTVAEFQKAISLGSTSNDPLTVEMVAKAERGLAILE